MPPKKYFDGDKLGPYNILMVRRTKRVGRKYYGLFICPFCSKEFESPIKNIVAGTASGHTKSCGCLRSYGEEKIANILTNNSIDFIREANFFTLVNQETGQRLRFDFLLPQYDIIIECNGLQHYCPINFFGEEEGYNKRHYLDDIKRQWAISNNYKVLEIKYKEDSDISETLILDFIKNNTKPAPQDL